MAVIERWKENTSLVSENAKKNIIARNNDFRKVAILSSPEAISNTTKSNAQKRINIE